VVARLLGGRRRAGQVPFSTGGSGGVPSRISNANTGGVSEPDWPPAGTYHRSRTESCPGPRSSRDENPCSLRVPGSAGRRFARQCHLGSHLRRIAPPRARRQLIHRDPPRKGAIRPRSAANGRSGRDPPRTGDQAAIRRERAIRPRSAANGRSGRDHRDDDPFEPLPSGAVDDAGRVELGQRPVTMGSGLVPRVVARARGLEDPEDLHDLARLE
jgi:hypothetical protein